MGCFPGDNGAVSLLDAALRLSASGPADPAEAWARYTQPRYWTEWAPHLSEVDYPLDVVAPGTSGRVRGLGGVVALFTVDAVDHAARTWSWSVRSGPLRVAFDHGVDATATGSSAWLVTHAPWPVALGYAPLVRWSLHRLVNT